MKSCRVFQKLLICPKDLQNDFNIIFNIEFYKFNRFIIYNNIINNYNKILMQATTNM